MVYESDFYTTRRPYSRPTVTSYSVTRREVPWHLVPTVPRPSLVPPCYTAFGCRGLPELGDDHLGYPYSLYRAQPYHRNIPYIGHKRLVIVQPSATGWRVKQSSLLGEIDRIYHKVRPSLAYQPKEDYLNSRSIMSFDDETRSIRAKTAEILKKIHTPVPRAQRPLPLPGDLYYSHSELPITERIVSDHYIDRLLSSQRPLPPVAITLAQYEEPRQYSRVGQGHLACLTYAGGRPILRRKNLASVEDYIRDDINVLSHYSRFRKAAEKAPHVPDTEYGSIPHMPPTKSAITGSWKSNAPRRTQSDKDYTRISDLSSGEIDASQERKKKRREAVEEAAMKEAEDEKRRAQELKRQEELAEQAAAERQEELERKARQEEEERIQREEAERLEALKKAQEEEERKAREEEERIAREEEERKAKEAEQEAKRKAKEEAERKAREEEERRIREEEEKRLKEEEERKAREEQERRLREEEERLAKEEEERRLKEEEERLAKEEEERRLKEEEEKLKAEEEEEKPEEPEEVAEPEAEEVNEPEEDAGNEPVVEEPQTPEPSAKSPADEEEDEEEEEEEDE